MTKRITIECPDCGGEGKTETLIGLTYEGDQRWRVEMCETCGGSGEIEVYATCKHCGELLVDDDINDVCKACIHDQIEAEAP